MHRCCYCSQGMAMGSCSCGIYDAQGNQSNSYLFNDVESYDSYQFSSVDCTLSLGTPSTRLTANSGNRTDTRRSGYCTWDLLQPKRSPSAKSGRGFSVSSNQTPSDPLVARRCANCDTTSTPLWRNGPRGPKSLCNACGIRYKKEERRAAASASANSSMEYQNNTWSHQGQYAPSGGDQSTFMDDDDRDAFLSWRLSVADMSSHLVQDYN